jgi:YbgC/YbaW family acyl-CoA thioester hydrolase
MREGARGDRARGKGARGQRDDGGADPRFPASIVVQRRIEWSDTDASGNYHNSAVFRLIENAETALLLRLGMLGDVYDRLPRVHVSADFLRPLEFKDLLDIHVSVAEVGRTSITYSLSISSAGQEAVRGTVVAVLLSKARGEPVEWPEDYRRKLETSGPLPAELLVQE